MVQFPLSQFPLRTLRTIRYLRPTQVINRVVRRVRPVRVDAMPFERPRLRDRAAQPPAFWPTNAFDGRSFRLLNERRPFQGTDRWTPAGASPLWVYTLHYFRYLWDLAPAAGLQLIRDWIATNPPRRTAPWDPYPISLRVREWIEWLLANPDVQVADREAIVNSIAGQMNVLDRTLEYHLLGNHLLENAMTMCWAGLSFDGPTAQGWLRSGARLLEEQLAQQLLADGTHDERSPMYQALIAESLSRLAAVADTSGSEVADHLATTCRTASAAMVGALAHLTHPDGKIALLNDSAFDVAPTVGQLQRRFSRTDRLAEATGRVWQLPHAGFAGFRRADADYLVFDCGPLGPDHQPGHGHADMLSFELTHRGQRLVTDTGVFTYSPGPARSYDRGTAAHNTAQVDGGDQSELWSAFRCGRRARPGSLSVTGTSQDCVFAGAYAQARGRAAARHSRQVRVEANLLSFGDEISVAGRHTVDLRLHLAPGLSVSRDGRAVTVVEQRRPLARLTGNGFEWAVTESPYHPEFGQEVLRHCLVAHFEVRDSLACSWQLALL